MLLGVIALGNRRLYKFRKMKFNNNKIGYKIIEVKVIIFVRLLVKVMNLLVDIVIIT